MTDSPRAKNGRAPDVFRPGGWIPMRCWRDEDEVDFAIVGTGAGGGTLACKLAEAGFSVVAFDAGPYWRPLEEFASDEYEQKKLFWLGERITGGEDPQLPAGSFPGGFPTTAPVPAPLSRSAVVRNPSHEDASPQPTLSARYRFSQPTFGDPRQWARCADSGLAEVGCP